MEQLTGLFLRVLAASAGCSAVLAPLLLLTPRIQRRVAARTLSVVFFLLALRLVLPLPPLRAAVTVTTPSYTVSLPAAQPPIQSPAEDVPARRPEAAEISAPAARRISVTDLLAPVWATGAAGCILWAAGSYTLVRRRLLGNAREAEPEEALLLARLRDELGVKAAVALRRSEQVNSPLALGLFRPTVLLPGRRLEPETLALVLRHELTHIRRRDVAYKLLLSLACAVHWFNPLVWLMSRAAGRNLELCCDDDAVRGLSRQERRLYGSALLDTAEGLRPLPFSTCFAGGKRQMKARLSNLFTRKKNSVGLACAALAAALLAGSLVACEAAVNTGKNDVRHALFQEYFYENRTPGDSTVLLADLTGDGLDEMLVLTIDGMSGHEPLAAEDFTSGFLSFYLIEDGEVAPFGGGSDITNSPAGWGHLWLVPRKDALGYALIDFRPYMESTLANYSYGIYTLGEDSAFIALKQRDVTFHFDPDSGMAVSVGGDASAGEVLDFSYEIYEDTDGALPLLTYARDTRMGDSVEFRYLNVPPEETFSGAFSMDGGSWQEHMVDNRQNLGIYVPVADPVDAEEAVDYLAASAAPYSGGYVFRIPNYQGDWKIQISGQTRLGEDGGNTPVHYLTDAIWTPGQRYSFAAEGAEFDELFLRVEITPSDGTAGAARDIDLLALPPKGNGTADG